MQELFSQAEKGMPALFLQQLLYYWRESEIRVGKRLMRPLFARSNMCSFALMAGREKRGIGQRHKKIRQMKSGRGKRRDLSETAASSSCFLQRDKQRISLDQHKHQPVLLQRLNTRSSVRSHYMTRRTSSRLRQAPVGPPLASSAGPAIKTPFFLRPDAPCNCSLIVLILLHVRTARRKRGKIKRLLATGLSYSLLQFSQI